MLERKRPHLLRQVGRVRANHRTERTATAAELRHAGRAVTGAAGALLLVHLLAGAPDIGAALRLVRSGLALVELPLHATLDDVGARLQDENPGPERDGLHFSSISRPLLPGRGLSLLAAGDLEFAGLRSILRQRLLDGVAHRDPAALGAGNGALERKKRR